MSATVNKLVYGDLTFTDDEIQDGEVYDAVALLSDALEIGTINVGLYIREMCIRDRIYGVQAAAVSFAAGNEYLATAIQECREGWMQCGIACLAQEGKAATATAAITEDTVKSDLIDTRTEIVKDKGRANVVMCTPEYYGLVLKAAGKDFTPSTNDQMCIRDRRERAARCAPMGIRPPVPGVANRSLSAGKPMCGKRDGSWLRRDMS